MFENLKKEVFEANLDLVKYNLVTFTWGNVSGIDREKGVVVIKPSGVKYEKMRISDMVVLDLDGNVIEGDLKPSSDTPTHLKLYKSFEDIKGVVHTHSTWATSWAQAGKSIPALGTTHADYFYGEIPCTNKLTKKQIEKGYEVSTADVIIETFLKKKPLEVPGVIVNNHGPFTWGKDVDNAVHNAVVLEEVAKMAFNTTVINRDIKSIESYLLNKHYSRKHGKDAYYGQ